MYILFGPSILHFEVILVGLIVSWNLLKRVLKESEKNLFVEFGYLVSRTVTLKDLGLVGVINDKYLSLAFIY